MNESTKRTCDETLALLGRWSDGELDEARAELVRTHLLDCRDCRGHYGQQRTLARWIVAEPAPAVPVGFGARVARLASEAAARTGGRPLDVAGLATRSFAVVPRERPVAEADALVPRPRASLERDGSLLTFVLACTAVAAAGLLALALVLGGQERPSGEELRAEPLPEVLRTLERLNADEIGAESNPGVPRR
jgi:hypothetical protein